MPFIEQSYQIKNIPFDNIYQESLRVLNKMGSQDIKEIVVNPEVKELSVIIPSMWGWGGMKIFIRIQQTSDDTILILKGYIAQMYTGPLTKQMDKFLQQLQIVFKEKYNYSFEYEKLTRFLPKYKLSINDMDKKVFIGGIIVTFFIALLGLIPLSSEIIGLNWSLVLIGIIILFGYKLGKKYLYR